MIALKPGLMVALATRIEPPPVYRKSNEETERPPGAEVRTWESEVVVQLPEEYDRAKKIRGRARSLMTGACTITPFHVLMCPLDHVQQLNAAETEARRIVQEFNEGATLYRVELQTFRGVIEEDSQRAAQAVSAEVVALLDAMERSVRMGDVKAARDAATQAKSLGRLLEGQAAERVSLAVKGVRKLAREIVDRVQGQAEKLTDVLTEEHLRPIAAARVVFLEADQAEPVPSPAATPEEIGAYLDTVQDQRPFLNHRGSEWPDEEDPADRAELIGAGLLHELDEEPDPVDVVVIDSNDIPAIRREAMERLGIPAAPLQPAEESIAAAQSLMNRFRPVAVEED